MTLLPAGVKVHLALGYTDMRKGMDSPPGAPEKPPAGADQWRGGDVGEPD